MRTIRPLIAGAAAAAAALSLVAFAATAQAQPSVRSVQDPTVPLGVETAVNLPACPTGNTITSVTPTPPGSINLVINANKAKLAGDWLSTGSTTFTVHCSGGTNPASKITVSAAPALKDATGVGSDTIQNVLDQFSADYNVGKSLTATHLYSWDATNPNTGAIGDSIQVKGAGCAAIARPDGSSAGITALTSSQVVSGTNCINFARSSRARASSDPPFAPGGVAFVDLAGDAVTWSSQATTNAPATLTTAQLAAIYNCTDTNWSQVGGKNAPIHAFIPQSGSGTRSFFLTAIGVATPGSCVSDVNGTLEENEGVNPVLKDPDAIFPYSIGKYIAEKFHSNLCITTSTCAPNANGIICTHTPGKNLFGCDTHGTMALKKINGVAPTTGTGVNTVINSAFPATFQRIVFEVVPFDPNTSDHIPGATSPVGGVNLEKLFGASGFTCSSAKAKADLKNYGFLVTPLCGVTG
jgi:ABC-type phosphate transport system substrate-binding protein